MANTTKTRPTAVLMSGQFRTFPNCIRTQHWHVYRHFPDVHFVVVAQNDVTAPGCVELLESLYGKARVVARLIEDPTDLPMAPEHLGNFAPTANAAPHENLVLQHWYQMKVWELFAASGMEPEVTIRMRGDNYMSNFDSELELVPDAVHSPYWGKFGGINDRLAVMSGRAPEAYFNVYGQIDTLLHMGCPFHPESLLKASLELAGVRSIDTLRSAFTTYRADGKHRYPEILMDDIANLVTARGG